MRATDGSRSPPPLALPPRSDRFQHWKLQRDRERRVERLGMAASPLSPPSASRRALGSAEERRARRVATHSEEEDELMDMIVERERQEREGDGGKRLYHLQQQQQQRRRQLPPLPTSALARSRRFTVPMQTAEQQREDEPAPRRPFGSAPRVQASLLDAAASQDGRNVASNGGNAAGTIPLSEITDRYAFQPASSLRWRSMKPPVTEEKDDLEQRKRQEEADADRILEQAAMDSGKRKDLWDNFYIGAKASRAVVQQHETSIRPAVYSTSSFREESLLQSQSSIGSWGHQEAPRSEGARARGKVESSGQHSSTQSSDVFGHSSPDNRLNGLRHRLRKGSESAISGASESGQSDRALHEELPGLTVQKRDRPEPDGLESTSTMLGDGLFDPKRAFDEIFPPWSVVFLASCVAAGVSGFFIEELMEVAGIFFKTMPFSVSRAEQQRLHERLEGLQKELRGFRSAASEIDSHSQKVFEEVRKHLDKLRSERERHQDMVAKEMHELRRYVLQMTYEMVEQERQVIHQRLKETVGVQVAGEVVSPPSSHVKKSGDRENSSIIGQVNSVAAVEHRPADAGANAIVRVTSVPVDNAQLKEGATPDNSRNEAILTEEDPTPDRTRAETVHAEEESTPDYVRVEAVLAKIDQIVNGVNLVDELPASVPAPAVVAKSETRSPPRGVLFMSWQATLVLFVMVIFGGYVGLRLRRINRRRKWLEDRRRRRQQQGRHRYFSPSRRAERVPDSEQDRDEQGEDEWEQAGSEHSVETVALMTPVNSGGEEDDEDYEPEEKSEMTSSAESVGHSEVESELDEHQDEYAQEDDDEYDREPADRDEMESDGQEETKGEEHDLSDEWEEMEREGDDAQDDPPEFVHPSTEYEQEEEEPVPASDQAAVYRMATTEVSTFAEAAWVSMVASESGSDVVRAALVTGQHRFPFVTRANAQAEDRERKSARMERRKFARRYL